MKKLIIIILTLASLIVVANAQTRETDKTAQAEVKKLAFLVGEWKGTGWMMGQDQVKWSFDQTEKIFFKLDSTAILIEGLGKSNGKIIHDALAIITSKGESDQYDFQSFLPSGQKGTFNSELIDGVYYWYPTEFIRYIIRINERGQWVEVGEINKGGNWYQFFEMTLDRKN